MSLSPVLSRQWLDNAAPTLWAHQPVVPGTGRASLSLLLYLPSSHERMRRSRGAAPARRDGDRRYAAVVSHDHLFLEPLSFLYLEPTAAPLKERHQLENSFTGEGRALSPS